MIWISLLNLLSRRKLVFLVEDFLCAMTLPLQLLLIVNNNLVLFSILRFKLSSYGLLVKLNLTIDTGGTSAVIGALRPGLLAAAILLITFEFTIAAFSNKLTLGKGYQFILKSQLIYLNGLFDDKLSHLIMLVIV